MPASAFILGGSGQIGSTLALLLARSGWRVRVCDRGTRELPAGLAELGVERRRADRDVAGELESVLGGGADVLVDVVAYDAGHARQIAGMAATLGSVVAISSASVYRDAAGRTLDEAETDEDAPRLPVPVPETNPVVDPGAATYSTRKAAMEEVLLDRSGLPATIVRPCAIHGPRSRHAREWYFLKRALDRRPRLIIDHRGASCFHTTSAENLAELVRLAAERPGDRVLNCGDPDPPTTLEIGRLVCGHVGHVPEEVLLDGAAHPPEIGATPWSVPHPFLVDMAAAERELRYAPVTTYAEAVGATLDWLIEATSGREWKDVLPQLAAYPWDLFAYEAEDRFLASHRTERRRLTRRGRGSLP